MKRYQTGLSCGLSGLMALLAFCLAVLLPATKAQPVSAPVTFSQAELDQMVAPIALYPDPLISQILVAATYPLEVVEAARFAEQNSSLKGQDLVDAMDLQTWDPSVKSLTQFPTVMAMMNSQLVWTQQLGDAFLAQQSDVMATVQALRARAQQRGMLTSNQQQQVLVQPDAISIQPAAPNVVYVPYYDPTIVYGNLWLPGYAPFVYVPAYAYQPLGFDSGFAVGISFGFGIGIVEGLFCPFYPDWRGRFIGRGPWPGHPGWVGGAPWRHDPAHRLGVAYRDAAIRSQYHPAPASIVNRDSFRGYVSNPGPENHPANSYGSEPVHPFMPAGPARQVETHSSRGQSSRAGSNSGGTFKHRN